MKGRKPIPTALRLITGQGRHRTNKDEPQPERVMPACPGWLSKEARAHWRRLAPQLFKARVLTVIDWTALAAFCDCLSRYCAAVRFLDQHGSVIVVRNDKGEFKFTQPAPQVGIAMKMLDQMRAIGSEFWLDAIISSAVDRTGG